MEKKSILKGYAKNFNTSVSKVITGSGVRCGISLNTGKESVFNSIHYHNVIIKPRGLSGTLIDMSYEELQKAPAIIQKLYFCGLTNTPVGTDLLQEANEKHPVYFV